MAPEIIDDEKYNNKVDLWSLGCILYELCTLNYCFYNSSIKKLIDQILYSEHEEHEKINTKIYGEKLENLIKLLLKRYYKTRPDINIFNKLLNENDSESNQKKIKYLRERYNSIIKNLENISYDYSRKDKYSEKEINYHFDRNKAIIIQLGTRFIRYGFSEDEEPHVIPTCIGFPKDDYSKNSYYLEGEDEDEEKEEEIKEII
jgi:serine/threonine protein kinase